MYLAVGIERHTCVNVDPLFVGGQAPDVRWCRELADSLLDVVQERRDL